MFLLPLCSVLRAPFHVAAQESAPCSVSRAVRVKLFCCHLSHCQTPRLQHIVAGQTHQVSFPSPSTHNVSPLSSLSLYIYIKRLTPLAIVSIDVYNVAKQVFVGARLDQSCVSSSCGKAGSAGRNMAAITIAIRRVGLFWC